MGYESDGASSSSGLPAHGKPRRVRELVENAYDRSRSPTTSEGLLTNLEVLALASGDEDLADAWVEEGVCKLVPDSAAARRRRR